MKIEILYSEVEKILKGGINKEIKIKYLEDQKVRVSTIGSDFDLSVVRMTESKIRLEYETGLIGKGLIMALTSMTPGIDLVCYHTLEIDLPKIHDFFSDVQLRSINFTEDYIKIEGCLKNK